MSHKLFKILDEETSVDLIRPFSHGYPADMLHRLPPSLFGRDHSENAQGAHGRNGETLFPHWHLGGGLERPSNSAGGHWVEESGLSDYSLYGRVEDFVQGTYREDVAA